MKKIISIIAVCVATLTLLTSCGAEAMYSNHQCYFIFNTQLHNTSLLLSAVTGDNGFCLVYKGIDQGVNKVYVEKYDEKDPASPYAYTTSIEPVVKDLVIGWDNGLLIGYSFSARERGENPIFAFDRHCPRCENKAKAKLQWNGSTKSVKCPECGTPYDLTVSNNGLDRYYAAYDGTILRVVNGR
jgi:hypothetical protein